jgi:hypothetical protein
MAIAERHLDWTATVQHPHDAQTSRRWTMLL